MKSFSKIAKEMTTLCPLMEDREKISMENIKKYYPDGISIVAIYPMAVDDDTFYVFNFTEDENVFAYSGNVLAKIFDAWVKECDGDLGKVNEVLMTSPVKVILGTAKNKNKQEYTTVSVVE